MKHTVFVISQLLLLFMCVYGRGINNYPQFSACVGNGSTGDPLFLTKYIQSERAADGKKAAEVPPLLNGIKSYSGYFTVNQNYDSNLFFWYFPAELKPETAPVVMWLQGGPGATSMFGLFAETGPFQVNSDLTLTKRDSSWSNNFHMVYVDNPVGTGFSFTNSNDGYVTNEEEVGRDLYALLVQFFVIFPELRHNEFYVAGESYAGKYIPAIGYTIHINNPTASVKINLKGLAIGNGLVDPENMMKYGDYLFQHGLVDQHGLQQFHNFENTITDAIKKNDYATASSTFNQIFSKIPQITGGVDIYDYLQNGNKENDDSTMSAFLCQSKIRKSLHVGNKTFNDGKMVQNYLEVDMMKSVKPWFQVLIEKYRILIYNGQLDIIVAYPLTRNFLEQLQWSGASDYKVADRKRWYVEKELAGYTKTVKNFTEILVRDAGHMVPANQPKWALDMINRFVFNTGF